LVRGRGEHGLIARRLDHVGDLGRVGGNDEARTHASLGNAPHNPEDERLAG
jgi:hypothetical protein